MSQEKKPALGRCKMFSITEKIAFIVIVLSVFVLVLLTLAESKTLDPYPWGAKIGSYLFPAN